MRLTFLAIVFFLNTFSNKCAAQDYTKYYQLINTAEETFVLNRDTTCFRAYDLAFAEFQPFLKDTYIASQIALFLNDTTRFSNYLSRCFENGMPLTAVNASPMIKRANTSALSEKISELYQQSFIAPKVDKELLDEICLRCYQSDSIKTYMDTNDSLIQLYHQSEDATRQFLLVNFLQKGLFPNQRLIGISTDKMQEDFFKETKRPDMFTILTGQPGYHEEEFSLRAKCPYNIVLHSRCFYREHKDLFIAAMLNGYLHPADIGILEETSIVWHHSSDNISERCGPPEVHICYNLFGDNPFNPKYNIFTNTAEGLKQVELNRAAIHMQKYSVDLLKKKMEEEFGFAFFFDFKNR